MAKMFKSFMAMLLALTLTLGLAACGAKPSKKTFEEAYGKEVDALTEGIDTYYGLVDAYDYQNLGVDADITFALSDSLQAALMNFLPIDLSFINNTTVKVSESMTEDMLSMGLGLAYGETDLATADIIMDLVKGELFLGVPVLNETFVKMGGFDAEAMAALDQLKTLDAKTLLPDSKALVQVIKNVYSAAMANLDQVVFADAKLTANGVEQSCTAYSVTFNEKAFAELCINVLKMLKDDQSFKTLICDFAENLDGSVYVEGESVGTPDEAYAEVIDELEYAIADLESILGEEEEDSALLVWTSYITDKKDVIGTKIEFTDEYEPFTVFMASATAKDKTGVEFSMDTMGERIFEVKGEFTDNGKTLAGSYGVAFEGESMLIVELANVDSKKLSEGVFIGSVIVSPGKGLLDAIAAEGNVDLSMFGLTMSTLGLKVDVEKNDGKEYKTALSLMNGSEPYVTITMEGVVGAAKSAAIPTNTTEDINAWVMGFDATTLVERAQTSGLPEYIVAILQQFAALLQMSVGY